MVDQDRVVKRVLFHPTRKIVDVAKEIGISKSQAYNFSNEFIKLWGMTADESKFPDKLVYI
jgi:hypothetical protein